MHVVWISSLFILLSTLGFLYWQWRSPSKRAQQPVKPEWDHTAWRIHGIPESFDATTFSQEIRRVFQIDDSAFELHSLSYDATDISESLSKTATISFRNTPLQLANVGNGYWSSDLITTRTTIGRSDALSFDKHFKGLTPLSDADGSVVIAADCLFIHGWGGHAIGSFRAPKQSFVWARDGLSKRFPTMRVWTYGYSSDPKDVGSIANIYEYAEDFRRVLRSLRRKQSTRSRPKPLILVVHSLGGLIVKEAIIRMSRSADKHDKINLQCIYGALFFGVPGQGMKTQAFHTMLAGKPSALTAALLDSDLAHRLRARQHEDFCNAFTFPDSKIISFFELRLSPTVEMNAKTKTWSRTGPCVLLVDPDSAMCGRSWETGDDFKFSLNKNHSDMVKFANTERDELDLVYGILEDFIAAAPKIVNLRLDLLIGIELAGQPDVDAGMSEDDKECSQSLWFEEMNWRKHDIVDPIKDTCMWLDQHPVFKDWQNNVCNVLWLKGKPGAGKSTVLLHAINTTGAQLKDDMIVVSFFFHARGSEFQKTTLGLWRTLLHQLMSSVPSLRQSLVALYKSKRDIERGRSWNWTERELRHFFFEHIIDAAKHARIRIFIDALDEAGRDVATRLIQDFRSLLAQMHPRGCDLSICFSCRHYPTLETNRGTEICVEEENAEDIAAYIDHKIALSTTRRADADVFVSDILLHARGSFQWVVLVVEQVLEMQRRGHSRQAIIKSIGQTPSDLNELYERLLMEIPEADRQTALFIFQWLCFAHANQRDLSILLVLFQEPEHTSLASCRASDFYIDDRETMRLRLREITVGLIEVMRHDMQDEDLRFGFLTEEGPQDSVLDSCEVELIHESVREFLISKGFGILSRDTTLKHISLAHLTIVRSCLTFLKLEEVCTGAAYQSTVSELSLLRYCTKQWIGHLKDANYHLLQDTELYDLIFGLLEDLAHCMVLDHHPQGFWLVDQKPTAMTILHLAALTNSPYLVDIAMTHQIDVNACNSLGQSALWLAAGFGSLEVVNELLRRPQVTSKAKDNNGTSALGIAIENYNAEIVRVLLTHDPIILHESTSGTSPLWKALENRASAIGQLLVEHGADVLQKHNGESLLRRAIRLPCLDFVEILLKAGADPHEAEEQGRTPFLMAVVGPTQELGEAYLGMIKSLLHHCPAKAERQDNQGHSPLHLARNPEVVRLLLDTDMNVNVFNVNGSTPLHIAAARGDTKIAEMLIQSGASVNALDKWHESPLHYTAERGSLPTLKLLLDSGADIYQKNSEGCSALCLAVSCGSSIPRGSMVSYGCLDPTHLCLQKEYIPEVYLCRTHVDDHEEVVKHILSHSPVGDLSHSRVGELNPGHETILQEIVCNMPNVLETVLENSIDQDQDALLNIALRCAIAQKKFEAIEILLRYGASASNATQYGTPIQLALEAHDLKTLKLLLRYGANPNLGCLCENVEGCLPLHTIIEIWPDEGCITCAQALRVLLSAGVDIDKKAGVSGFTPLQRAVAHRRTGMVDLLIAYGASVDAEEHLGLTALHLACSRGFYEIVLKLCKAGSNVNVADRVMNRTPLHMAVGHPLCVQYLMDAGAEIDCLDSSGRSECYEAAMTSPASTTLLVRAGANVCLRTKQGSSALHQASIAPRFTMSDVLANVVIPMAVDIDLRDEVDATALQRFLCDGIQPTWQILQCATMAFNGGQWQPYKDAGPDGEKSYTSINEFFKNSSRPMSNAGLRSFLIEQCKKTVQGYLIKGANINIRSKAGSSALSWARDQSNEYPEIAELILDTADKQRIAIGTEAEALKEIDHLSTKRDSNGTMKTSLIRKEDTTVFFKSMIVSQGDRHVRRKTA